MQTTLGSLLRSHRERAGLTQDEVVARLTAPDGTLAITQAHVSAIELGRRGPSRGVLAQLSDLYGLSAEQRGELLAAPLDPAA